MELVVLQEAQALGLIDLGCCPYDEFASWLEPLDDDEIEEY